MFLAILFILYLVLLLLVIIYFDLIYYKIQAKGFIHPQVVTFMLPFMINFLMAKFVFDDINPFFTTLAPCILIYLIGNRLKKCRIFGLTGGIACGKSTLIKQMIDNLGSELAVIDCDKINGQLRMKGKAGYKIILKLLKQHGQDPKEYLHDHNNEIKRQALSNYAFQHKEFLHKLSKQVGTHIFIQIFKQIWSNIVSNKKLILIDAPTLYQTKTLTYICYPIIVVGCPEKTQIQRLAKNRNIQENQARSRIKSQMPLAIKKQKADIYIENSGTPDQMFSQTLKALNKILSVNKK